MSNISPKIIGCHEVVTLGRRLRGTGTTDFLWYEDEEDGYGNTGRITGEGHWTTLKERNLSSVPSRLLLALQ